MKSTKQIIAEAPVNSYTVNRNKQKQNTVNSSEELYQKIEDLIQSYKAEPEVVAQEIANKLDDQRSLDFYRILVTKVRYAILYEILSIVMDTDRNGKIKTTKAKYFMWHIKMRGIITKFKKS